MYTEIEQITAQYIYLVLYIMGAHRPTSLIDCVQNANIASTFREIELTDNAETFVTTVGHLCVPGSRSNSASSRVRRRVGRFGRQFLSGRNT